MMVVAVGIWYLLEHTATGRRLYATGFNPDAARLAGVPVNRLRFMSLVTSGTLAGATGIVLASILGSGSPTAGTPYLLPAFAAAFLGATQLKNGRFNAWGTIIAVLLLGTGTTGLALAAAPQWSQSMFVGVVLIGALAVTGLQRRTSVSRGARASTAPAWPAPISPASHPRLHCPKRTDGASVGPSSNPTSTLRRRHPMSITPRRRTPRQRRVTLVPMAALAVIALLAAGCGSSGSSSSSGGSATANSSNSSVSAAQQLLDKYSARPTAITQTTPIKKPIPTGKKITFISCGVEACAVQGPILQQGAKTLGWSVKQVGTDGSPEKVQNAIQAAVRNGTNAIILNAADVTTLGKSISDAKAKGVEFVTCCSLAKQGQDVLFNTGTPEQNAPIGDILAVQGRRAERRQGGRRLRQRLGVRHPGGRRHRVREEVQGALPRLQVREDRHPADVARQGRSGPHRVLPAQPSQGELRRAVGVRLARRRPAGRAAGRRSGDKVKIIGQGGNQQTYQDVKSGQIAGVTPSSLYGYDYSMLDALARKWSGEPVLQTPPEFWFMGSSDVPPAATSAAAFPIVTDYQSQWAKLWGK